MYYKTSTLCQAKKSGAAKSFYSATRGSTTPKGVLLGGLRNGAVKGTSYTFALRTNNRSTCVVATSSDSFLQGRFFSFSYANGGYHGFYLEHVLVRPYDVFACTGEI